MMVLVYEVARDHEWEMFADLGCCLKKERSHLSITHESMFYKVEK